ncbi:hypothetical protein L1987_11058 [Smallanthus sonchifolius]|uniref:Uncharacterized protein n=1 Tax=Smallanthus sonchifolius TaxID=185202 RepID=A0ACB9J9W1_9ASTR|nr:hypothetical protein L1987_11058 [Smallanthus sonchifolius]
MSLRIEGPLTYSTTLECAQSLQMEIGAMVIVARLVTALMIWSELPPYWKELVKDNRGGNAGGNVDRQRIASFSIAHIFLQQLDERLQKKHNFPISSHSSEVEHLPYWVTSRGKHSICAVQEVDAS